MATIVLNDEKAHQEPGGQHGKNRRRRPVAAVQGDPSQEPQPNERNQRDEKLAYSAGIVGLTVARDDARPVPGIRDGRPRRWQNPVSQSGELSLDFELRSVMIARAGNGDKKP